MTDAAESSLQRFLLDPAETAPLAGLPARFPHALIVLRAPGAARLADDPSAPGKVRGALGEALKPAASAEAVDGRPCPWSPPCALDLLFRTQGRMTRGLEIPKPFTLALDAEGPDLIVSCRLFGLAADWSGQVADALTRGLRGGLRHPAGGRLDVTARSVSCIDGAPGWPALADAAPERLDLVFETPFVLRSGAQAHAGLPALVTGIGNRVTGLSRWMGWRVDADWLALKAVAEALVVERSTVGETSWIRASRRQGRVIGVTGFEGRARIAGPLGPVLPLLALGQLTHAGAHAALGMGRYRIEFD